MPQFMAVSTFIDGTNMAEVLKVVEEEKAKVSELQETGHLGAVRLAVPEGKVFLDVFSNDAAAAKSVVEELPMAKWWNIEVYALSGTA
ncbi:MAG: muconolactone Delta-isomerase family protein [Micrococcales bacterium]